MSNDIFLKIDGINSESQDATHADEIDVIDWSWKVEQRPAMMSWFRRWSGESISW